MSAQQSIVRAMQGVRMRVALFALLCIPAACSDPMAKPEQTDSESLGDLGQLFRIQWSAEGVEEPAAHAFLLKRPGLEPLALTAFHVAGPLYAPHAAGDVLTNPVAWLRSPIDLALVRLGQRLPIEGAQVIGASGSQNDLAAYAVIDWDPARALELAATRPAEGDTVYVLAVHIPDPTHPHPLSGARRHPARVDVSHDSVFAYTYLESANTNYTSGAAVVDRNGRVVGVNVGSRVMNEAAWENYRARFAPCCSAGKPGDVIGLAVHVYSIRRLLGGPDVPTALRER